jgi:hypothetical protein
MFRCLRFRRPLAVHKRLIPGVGGKVPFGSGTQAFHEVMDQRQSQLIDQEQPKAHGELWAKVGDGMKG